MAPLSRFLVFASLYACLFPALQAHPISMMFGTIEFPRSLKMIFPYKIFYEGQQVKTEVEDNRLLFTIPINRPMISRFFILFVEDPYYVLKEADCTVLQNTVDYLKSGTTYRIFELRAVGGSWHVQEYLLPESLIIPDNTIIVYMPPAYIDTLTGGTGREFPRVMIKENILDLLGGSLDELKRKAEALAMESIHMNSLHVPVREVTRVAGNKRIVVPTV